MLEDKNRKYGSGRNIFIVCMFYVQISPKKICNKNSLKHAIKNMTQRDFQNYFSFFFDPMMKFYIFFYEQFFGCERVERILNIGG